MLARAERLHRQFFHIADTRLHRIAWEPPADVLETRDHVVILVGLPGVDAATVRASIEDHVLIVSGERTLPRNLGRLYIHRMELPLGPFERKVTMPRGRYDNAEYSTSDGCLVVTLSKATG